MPTNKLYSLTSDYASRFEKETNNSKIFENNKVIDKVIKEETIHQQIQLKINFIKLSDISKNKLKK